MKFFSALLVAVLFCSVLYAAPNERHTRKAIHGFWTNDSKTIIIQIYDDNAGYTRGKVVWMRDSLDALGNDKRDVRNSNVNLRSQQIVGMDILYGYRYDEKNLEWKNGIIYNFDNGTEYHGKMWLDENDKLYIKGYWWWFWFLSKTKHWERVAAPHSTLPVTKK